MPRPKWAQRLTVELDYFNLNGKWKYEGSFVTLHKPLFKIWEEVRVLQEEGRLPGLATGTWAGPIYVRVSEHENDHPHLIMPQSGGDDGETT